MNVVLKKELPMRPTLSATIAKIIILCAIVLIMPPKSRGETPLPVKCAAPYYRLYLGFDNGLSCRYFISDVWAVGVSTGQNENMFARNRAIYWSSHEKRTETYRPDSIVTDIQDRNSSATTVLFNILYRKAIAPRFSLTGSAAFGGGIDFERTNNSYLHQKWGSKYLEGNICLLPGFRYDRFTVEIKLGLRGNYSWTKQTNNYSNSSESFQKGYSIGLIHPDNLISGLMLHVALF